MGNLLSGYIGGLYIKREDSDWDLARRNNLPSRNVTPSTQGGDSHPPGESADDPDMDPKQGKRTCGGGDTGAQTKEPKCQKLEPKPSGSGDNPGSVNSLQDLQSSSSLQDPSKEINKFASSRNRDLETSQEVSLISRGHSPIEYQSSTEDDGHIDALPAQVLIQVFRSLTVTDLMHNVCLVSKYWYELSHDPDLWRVVNLKGQTKINDKVLQKVVSFSESVTSVDISDARSVSDDGIEALAKQCTGLKKLKLIRCLQLKESAFIALGNHCPLISSLYLNCCFAVTDKALQTIAAGCPKIKILNINQCSHVSNDGVKAIGRHCQDLRELAIDQCKQVGDPGLLAIMEGCPNLTKLSAMSCVFTSNGISQLTKLPRLQHLELHDVLGVTDDCIMDVVRSCHDLEMLNLALCTQITDRSVDFIARYAKRLKSLYLASCDLTNQALISLGAHSRTVETVDVGWCSNITDEGAVSISEKCATLRTLALIRCDKVTIQTMDYLVEKYPQVHYSTFWLDCRRLMNQAQRMGYPTSLPQGPGPQPSQSGMGEGLPQLQRQ